MLILTDGSEGTEEMARGIAAALKGNKVSVKNVSEFKGNDILPARAFFLGCEKPKPDSFTYLADLLKHINLAGCCCGVFTPAVNAGGSHKTAKYLTSLFRDSEAVLNPEPLFISSAAVTKKWVQKVISASY